MARTKKTEQFSELYADLSVAEKKILKSELEYAIKAQIKAEATALKEAQAKELRDTLKIHDKVKFQNKKGLVNGEVISISVDKVQVLFNNGKEKKTVPYSKIVK